MKQFDMLYLSQISLDINGAQMAVVIKKHHSYLSRLE